MPLRVRPASKADVDRVVALHKEAFAGAIGTAIGSRYIRSFFRWFLGDPLSVFLVAEDDEVVGYVVGAPVGYANRLTRALALEIAVGLATHPSALLHRSVRAQARSRALQLVGREDGVVVENGVKYGDETFALVGIGTRASARGRGVGRALVEALEREAFQRGALRVALDVYTKNGGARALYAACGYVEVLKRGDALTLAKQRL